MAEDTKRAAPASHGSGRPVGSGSNFAAGYAIARANRPKPISLADWIATDRADRVIRFIEELTVPSGVGQGKPFHLREWQRRFIRDVYGPKNDKGKRIVRRAILSMGRKNGKTALIAALALVHLIGPESVTNGEIYSAANDRDQAAQIFKVAAQIVRADDELSLMLKVIDSTKTIACYSNGSFYRAVSAEAGTKHGLNPTFVIYDELAQAKRRDLYDVLDTSMGAREEPLFVVISTQSNDPQHILSRLIDDGLNSKDPTIVCHLYAVPDDCKDVFDPMVWQEANPALGDFRSLEDLTAMAEKAKRMPADEPTFRNLYLNQRVSPISSLISRREWMECLGPCKFVPGEEVYLALDMSAVVDLTSLIMVSKADPTKVWSFNWKPEEKLLEHSARDFGGGSMRYVDWYKAGFIDVSPGKSIDPAVIVKKLAELCQTYKVLGMAYDPWRKDDLFRAFERAGLPYWEDSGDSKPGGGLRTVLWRQGFQTMAPAVDALVRAVVDRSLINPDNHCLTWAMANAMAMKDPAGNRKLAKDKSIFRIDPAVALCMAIGLKSRDLVKAKPKYQLFVV